MGRVVRRRPPFRWRRHPPSAIRDRFSLARRVRPRGGERGAYTTTREGETTTPDWWRWWWWLTRPQPPYRVWGGKETPRGASTPTAPAFPRQRVRRPSLPSCLYEGLAAGGVSPPAGHLGAPYSSSTAPPPQRTAAGRPCRYTPSVHVPPRWSSALRASPCRAARPRPHTPRRSAVGASVGAGRLPPLPTPPCSGCQPSAAADDRVLAPPPSLTAARTGFGARRGGPRRGGGCRGRHPTPREPPAG